MLKKIIIHFFLLLIVGSTSIIFAQNNSKSESNTKKVKPKIKSSKYKIPHSSFHGGIGLALFSTKVTRNENGTVNNAFSGYGISPMLYITYQKHLSQKSSWLTMANFLYGTQNKTKMSFGGISTYYKHNFTPPSSFISPFITVGLNYSLSTIKRTRSFDKQTFSDTLNTSTNIIVRDVSTEQGSVDLRFPSIGLNAGLGLEFHFKKKIGGFIHYMYNLNFVKSDPILKDNFPAQNSNLNFHYLIGGVSVYLHRNEAKEKMYAYKKVLKSKKNFNNITQANQNKNHQKVTKGNKSSVVAGTNSYTNKSYTGRTKTTANGVELTKDDLFMGRQKLPKLPSSDGFKNPVAVGKVYSDNGQNVGDVDVLLLDDKGAIVQSSRTDKNGVFAFKKVAGKDYTTVLANRNPSLKAEINMREQDPDLKLSNENFKFNKLQHVNSGAILTGKLINDGGGSNEDVSIVLLDKSGNVVASTNTKKGLFAFKKLQAGDYQVVINSNNKNLKAEVNLTPNDPDMMLAANDFKKFNFNRLDGSKEGAIVTGNVKFLADGQLNEDLSILAINDNGEVVNTTKVNKKGNFAFRNLPSSNYHFVIDSKNKDLKATVNAVNSDPDLSLPKDKFQFQKLGTNGNIVAGKIDNPFHVAGVENIDIMLLDQEGKVVNSVRPNKDGTFAFSKLDNVDYQIALNTDNKNVSASILGIGGDPNLSIAGENFKKGFAFEKLNSNVPTGAVLGTMSAQDEGVKISDVDLFLIDENGNVIDQTKSNSKGKFAFTRLSNSSSYQVLVGDNGKGLTAKVTPTSADPSLVLDESAFSKYQFQKLNPNAQNILIGKVTNSANPDDVKDVSLLLIDDEGKVVEELYTSQSGTYTVRNLKKGNYQIIPTTTNPAISTSVIVANAEPSNSISAIEFNKHQFTKTDYVGSTDNIIVGDLNVSDGTSTKANVPILILDDQGKIIAKTATNNDGKFIFRKLSASNSHVIVDSDNPAYKLSADVGNIDPKLEIKSNNFAYNKLSPNSNDNIVVGKIHPNTNLVNVDDVTLLLLDDKGTIVSQTKSSKSGHYSFSKLPAQNYQVVIDHAHSASIKNDIMINSDPDLVISMSDMQAYNTDVVVGQLDAKDIKHSSKAEILAINKEGAIVARTRANEHGSFSFKKLGKDNYKFVINSDIPNLKADVEAVDNDPNLKLDFTGVLKYNPVYDKMEPLTPRDLVKITGVIPNPSHTSGVVMLLNGKGDVLKTTRTNESGVFSFPKVNASNDIHVVFQKAEHKVDTKFQVYEDNSDGPSSATEKTKVISSMYYGHNETAVTDGMKDELQKFVDFYKKNPNLKSINLNGYGDATGSDAANYSVTKKRSDAVRAYLISQGIPADKLKTNPMGKSLQFKNKYNQPDPKLNRKVDIEIIE